MNLAQTKLLALTDTGAPGDLDAETTDTHYAMSSDPTSKKKRINASTGKRDDRHVVSNLNSMLAELADENHPTGREPATLFVALDHFAELASLHELPDFPADIFFSATRRVIHAASDALYSILETNPNLNGLQVLHDLMLFVIKTSFLLLPSSKSFGYLLFNQLSGLLLSPVIHSFFPLSMKSLGYLLEPASTNPIEPKGAGQKSPDLHIDSRPMLLEFFQGIVAGLFSASCSLGKHSFCQDASSMRDMLILETIRHLKGILSPIPVDNQSSDATCSERVANKVDSCSVNPEKYLRVRRLAVKDAMWHLCSVFHILIGSRTFDISTSAANSDNKSIEDVEQTGCEILKDTISRELFEFLIDPRLRHHGKPRLPFGTSQTPVGSLSDTDTTRTKVKTVQELLVTPEEAGSHRDSTQREKPMQWIFSSNHHFESNCEISSTPFDHTDYHDSSKISNHGTRLVNGIVTKGDHMHHVLDDAERGMLLCVVERYVVNFTD